MNHDTETIDRLFLELSQFTKATTSKELALQTRVEDLEDLLRSARHIAERGGVDVAWHRFADAIEKRGIGAVTPRTFRRLEGDSRP